MILRILLASALIFPASLEAAEVYSVQQLEIPKAERRQQQIAGIVEFRAKYTLPKASDFLNVAVVSYNYGGKGVLDKTYKGVLAPNFGSKEGELSVAWIRSTGELVTVIENGQNYSPFSSRIALDRTEFDDVTDGNYGFSITSVKDGWIPVMGISGQRNMKMPGWNYQSPQEFIKACELIQYCLVVYLHTDSKDGSNPPPVPAELKSNK